MWDQKMTQLLQGIIGYRFFTQDRKSRAMWIISPSGKGFLQASYS